MIFWAVSYKGKHTLTIWPGNSTPRCLPKRNGSICLQEGSVCITALFLIAQNWNVHPLMNGQILINPCDGILPGNQKESTTSRHNMGNLNNIVLSKRSQRKAHAEWFHCYGTLEKAKLIHSERKQNFLSKTASGQGWRVGIAEKGYGKWKCSVSGLWWWLNGLSICQNSLNCTPKMGASFVCKSYLKTA